MGKQIFFKNKSLRGEKEKSTGIPTFIELFGHFTILPEKSGKYHLMVMPVNNYFAKVYSTSEMWCTHFA